VANEHALAIQAGRQPDAELERAYQEANAKVRAIMALSEASRATDWAVEIARAKAAMGGANQRPLIAAKLPRAGAVPTAPPVANEVDVKKVKTSAELVEATRIIADEQIAEKLLEAFRLLSVAQPDCCVDESLQIAFAEESLALGKKLDALGDHHAIEAVKLAIKPLYAVPGEASEKLAGLRDMVMAELHRLKSNGMAA
jgi:hypothetical protein